MIKYIFVNNSVATNIIGHKCKKVRDVITEVTSFHFLDGGGCLFLLFLMIVK